MIDELIKEMQELQEAKEILKQIYSEVGPYYSPDNILSEDIIMKLRNFFKFDDSE